MSGFLPFNVTGMKLFRFINMVRHKIYEDRRTDEYNQSSPGGGFISVFHIGIYDAWSLNQI